MNQPVPDHQALLNRVNQVNRNQAQEQKRKQVDGDEDASLWEVCVWLFGHCASSLGKQNGLDRSWPAFWLPRQLALI